MDSRRKARRLWASSALVLTLATGCQLPATPVTTIWQRLGVPQAAVGLRDGLTNRRGNFPGLERRPPLKRIADPANLESPNDAIKVAAQVKMEQDMKRQKIKAIKYLATVGCGCYNDNGAISDALLKALKDCDPDVRLAAVEAIQEAAGTCNCCYDGCTPTCCTGPIQEQLMEMAYGEKDGCPVEPNPEIRAAAAAAVSACPALPVEEVQQQQGEPTPMTQPESLPTPETEAALEMPSEDQIAEAASLFSTISVKVQRKARPEPQAKAPAAKTMAKPTVSSGDPRFGYGDVQVADVQIGEVPDELLGQQVPAITSDNAGKFAIDNPELLEPARVVDINERIREVTIEFQSEFALKMNTGLVLVTPDETLASCRVVKAGGKQVTVRLDDAQLAEFLADQSIRVGLIGN